MNNYKLLKKYKIKLSIYFALFILFSIWLIVLFFDISKYLNNTRLEKNFLINKTNQIKNIIRNSSAYSKLNEVTFKKLLKKITEDTQIKSSSKKIILEISNFNDYNKLSYNTFSNIDNYKYYKIMYNYGELEYEIIVRKELRFKQGELLNNYTYFLLFSLPFLIFFYFIGYFFVGRNLKPIKETIKNLEDFTGNINHEFKTPLTEIISSLELSKKTGNYKTAINQSIKSAKKIDTILNSLLGIIHITDSSYKKQRINIVNYSKKIINKYEKEKKKKNITINLKISSNFIIKKINKEHYYICFSNILSNAIKYSKKDSIIDIKLSKNYLKIKDYGIGISEKNLESIFSRYFRENYTENIGMGIGLSLTKKICDINKWIIKIKSEKNKETIVTIKF